MRVAWLLASGAALALAPRQGGKTIALSSINLPSELRGMHGRGARFDSLITSQLRTTGFTIVPAQASESIWLRLRDSVGGYYDTYTGKLVEAKLDVVHTATLRELHARYGADGWLHTKIAFVGASFTGGKVKWHGTEQTSGARGGIGGFLLGTKTGTVPALSLFVVLEDTAGKELYSGVGGIELAVQIQGGLPAYIPQLMLLNDEARNIAAVHLALDSLSASLGAKPGP